MPISVAVPKETVPGERRVALVPGVAEQLASKGLQVLVQSDAGLGAFYRDSEYATARIVPDADTLFAEADIVFTVQPLKPEAIEKLREGTLVIGFLHPYEYPERTALLRDRGITSFAMELIPRLSRAQGMDALFSHSKHHGRDIATDHFSGPGLQCEKCNYTSTTTDINHLFPFETESLQLCDG